MQISWSMISLGWEAQSAMSATATNASRQIMAGTYVSCIPHHKCLHIGPITVCFQDTAEQTCRTRYGLYQCNIRTRKMLDSSKSTQRDFLKQFRGCCFCLDLTFSVAYICEWHSVYVWLLTLSRDRNSTYHRLRHMLRHVMMVHSWVMPVPV